MGISAVATLVPVGGKFHSFPKAQYRSPVKLIPGFAGIEEQYAGFMVMVHFRGCLHPS